MGGLAKRVPTTLSSLGFSWMALKTLGICSENTSMMSLGICSTQPTHHQSAAMLECQTLHCRNSSPETAHSVGTQVSAQLAHNSRTDSKQRLLH